MKKKPAELVDYIFVEEKVLDNYLSQLPPKSDWKRNYEWKFSLSLTGPKLDVAKVTPDDREGVHNKIGRLVEFLTAGEMLLFRRPYGTRDPNSDFHFVLETTTATKVIFPADRLAAIPGLSQFAVWVSDPNPADFTDEP